MHIDSGSISTGNTSIRWTDPSEHLDDVARPLAVNALLSLLEALKFDAGSVYLPVHGASNVFHIVYQRGFSHEYLEETDTIVRGEGFCGTALALNEVRLSEDVSNDSRYVRPQIKIDGFHSFIALPIAPEIGLINLATYNLVEFDSGILAVLGYVQSTLARMIELEMNKRDLEAYLQVSERLSYLRRELFTVRDTIQLAGLVAEEARLTLRSTSSVVILSDERDVTMTVRGRIRAQDINRDCRDAISSFKAIRGLFFLNRFSDFPAIVQLTEKAGVDFVCRNVFTQGGYRGCICIGITAIENRHAPEPVSSLQEYALDRIAAQVGSALNAAEYEKQKTRVALIEEYARLSRETHDFMAQEIISVQRMVEAIRMRLPETTRAEFRESFDDLLGTIQELYAGTREVISDLRVYEQASSFEKALGRTVEMFRKHFDGEVRYTAEQGLLLPPEAQIQFLRIIQEACSNIRKHSNARHADITITHEGGTTICKITDDGIGFDRANLNSNESFGLIIMSERAKSFGGSVEIASSPGEGTSITITIPKGKES